MRYSLKRSAEPWKCYQCGHWYSEDDACVEAASGSHERRYCPECGLVEVDNAQSRLERVRLQILHYHGTGQLLIPGLREVEDEVERARRLAG